MQDEVNTKVVAIAIKGGKITAEVLDKALKKFVEEIEKAQKTASQPKTYRGKQSIEDFRKSLSSIQLEIFDVVMLGGVGVREYARQKGINHKTVVEAIASMRKKLKKFF